MTFFYKLIDFSQTCWYIISITIISGVNFRPKKCWAKVEQKSCEPKTRKNVIFRYTGSRKMSISDVIVVVEKKCDMFWRVDVMRSTQKKKSSKSVHKQKIGRGGVKITPPLVNHRIWKTLIYHGLILLFLNWPLPSGRVPVRPATTDKWLEMLLTGTYWALWWINHSLLL